MNILEIVGGVLFGLLLLALIGFFAALLKFAALAEASYDLSPDDEENGPGFEEPGRRG